MRSREHHTPPLTRTAAVVQPAAGGAAVELPDEHDVSVRVDHLELAGTHVERVLDLADVDAGCLELGV